MMEKLIDGDVICAQAAEERESVVMAASRVLVASRPEIQKQQKADPGANGASIKAIVILLEGFQP